MWNAMQCSAVQCGAVYRSACVDLQLACAPQSLQRPLSLDGSRGKRLTARASEEASWQASLSFPNLNLTSVLERRPPPKLSNCSS